LVEFDKRANRLRSIDEMLKNIFKCANTIQLTKSSSVLADILYNYWIPLVMWVVYTVAAA